MATTKTDYGQCTEDAPREPGAWPGRHRIGCPRPATGHDGLCGPHRNGKRTRERAQARWDADREQERVRRAQADFVAAWRADHSTGTWGDIWVCPLCGKAIQTTAVCAKYHPYDVDAHQEIHHASWERYQALGTPSSEREAE